MGFIMGTRSLRLDHEAKAALAEIDSKTGASISQANNCRIIEFRNKAQKIPDKSASDFFNHFDLWGRKRHKSSGMGSWQVNQGQA
jgi:hypothetical protein